MPKMGLVYGIMFVCLVATVSSGPTPSSGSIGPAEQSNRTSNEFWKSLFNLFNSPNKDSINISATNQNDLVKSIFDRLKPNSSQMRNLGQIIAKMNLPKEMEQLLSTVIKPGFFNNTNAIQSQVMNILSAIQNFGSQNSSTISQILQSPMLAMFANPDMLKEILNLFSPQNSTGILGVLSRVEPLVMGYLKGMMPSINDGLINMNVSSNCSNDFTVVLSELLNGKLWALQYLDAIGKPNSGLMEGAMNWLGSFHECNNIHSPNVGESFNGNYCQLKIPLPMSALMALSSTQAEAPKGNGLTAGLAMSLATISYGICVPSSCSSEDVFTMVNKGLMSRLPVSLYGVQKHEVTGWCNKEQDFKHDKRAIIVTGVCAGIGFIILIATIYNVVNELVWKRTISKKIKTTNKSENLNVAYVASSEGISNVKAHTNGFTKNGISVPRLDTISNGFIINADPNVEQIKTDMDDIKVDEDNLKAKLEPEVILSINATKNVPEPTKQQRPKPGVVGGILLAFSLYSNSKKILNTGQRSGSLGAVNGVRFLSMSWVILGHTFFFHLPYQNNLLGYAKEFTNRWTAQGITNATVSVDSFFTLSGLLVAYLTLKEMGKKKSAMINWFMFYFHRFWRLTPPYMLIIMVYVSLIQYWGSGPEWLNGQIEPVKCNTYWWRNLIYINNFDSANSCIGWTWYLANDMQFYVISPIILIPLFYSKIIGMTILGLFFLATFTATGVITYVNKFTVTEFRLEYMDMIYVKPWCRIGPYLVGLFVGYVLYKTKCKVKLHLSTVILGWCCATVTALAVLYGKYGDSTGRDPFSLEATALYTALHRTAWGAALGWVLFACCTGYGGIVNTFLSWNAFVPLARLTYMTYLVHPIVMLYFNNTTLSASYMSDVSMSYLFIGDLFFSYAFAFLVSLAFEAPMMGLERVIFRRK